MKNILIFGGTDLARKLLQQLLLKDLPCHYFYSVKATTRPIMDDNVTIVSGGFSQYGDSSVAGLKKFCHKNNIIGMVDATSLFARQMTMTIHQTASDLTLPAIKLLPTSWQTIPAIKKAIADGKIILVDTIDGLITHYKNHHDDKNTLLALGRQDGFLFLQQFCQTTKKPPTTKFIWRMIYPSAEPLPDDMATMTEILLSPPLPFAEEEKLLKDKNIGLLIAKNSGGDSLNKEKILAGLHHKIKIILLAPPARPKTHNHYQTTDHINQAIAWIKQL